MREQVTRVTRQSWGSRLGTAIAGIGGGFLLVIAAIAGLGWNENRAVETSRSLSEGAGSVVELDQSGAARDPAGAVLDTAGMLVHVSGDLAGPVPVDTHLGGPAVPVDTTRLTRVVEMYQWKEERRSETRNKVGGGTETVTRYTYSTEWSAQQIDSGRFAEPSGRQNPPMPVRGDSFAVDRVLDVGDRRWTVPAAYVSRIGEERALSLSDSDGAAIAQIIGAGGPASVAQGVAYFGADPMRPEVGDIRISYSARTADNASVVASDGGDTLKPWTSSNGREIFLIREGNVAAAAMFEEEQQANVVMTWGLRLAGFVAMFVGFRMMFGIVGVIGDVIPFVGSLARFATGVVAFALTMVLAPVTIGIAWLAVRPLLGAVIVAAGLAAAAGAWFIAGRRNGKKAAVEDTVPAATG